MISLKNSKVFSKQIDRIIIFINQIIFQIKLQLYIQQIEPQYIQIIKSQ